MEIDWSDRFWSKVARVPSECWLWARAIQPQTGYGAYQLTRTKCTGAHRFAFEQAFGKVPDGLVVCHRCDVKRCVNPAHLFAGTQADNIRDKVAKGRQARGTTHGSVTRPGRTHRGEAHHQSRLTREAVLEIRADRKRGVPLTVLATRFDVDITTVSKAALGHTWGWL